MSLKGELPRLSSEPGRLPRSPHHTYSFRPCSSRLSFFLLAFRVLSGCFVASYETPFLFPRLLHTPPSRVSPLFIYCNHLTQPSVPAVTRIFGFPSLTRLPPDSYICFLPVVSFVVSFCLCSYLDPSPYVGRLCIEACFFLWWQEQLFFL